MKRTFIAVNVKAGKEMLRMMEECKEILQKENIRWVHPGKIHITLKFLGDTAEQDVPGIIAELKRVLSDCHTITLRFRGTGVFRNVHDPRVFWIGIDAGKDLYTARDKVEDALERIGFNREEKSFSPHLTLARIRHIRRKDLLKNLLEQYKDHDFQETQVKEVIYYESILKPEGPEYFVLAEIPLVRT
jgi:2'-5' RNA ligase